MQHRPLWALLCRFSSVIFPLDSNKNLRCPFHFRFNSIATLINSSPSMLSSMMTSAPAAIASSASSLFLTSTSRSRLNPPTFRASLIASVIDPAPWRLTRYLHERKKKTNRRTKCGYLWALSCLKDRADESRYRQQAYHISPQGGSRG